MNNLLELGSVVELVGSGVPAVIIGYFPVDRASGKMYRYTCVGDQFGTMGNGRMLFIDEENIEKVLFHGYADEKSREFRKQLEIRAQQHSSGQNRE